MKPEARRVLSFALVFVPAFVIAVWLYPAVVPVYQRAVLAVANAFLVLLSPAAEVHAVLTGRWQILVHSWHAKRVVTYTLGGTNVGLLAFSQMVVLSAILVATPVRVKDRLRLLVHGTGVMFCLHVVCVVGCAYGMALVDDPKNAIFRSLPIVLGPLASGLAVVVWSAFTWRFWFVPTDLPVERKPRQPSSGRPKHGAQMMPRSSARPHQQS